MAGTDATPGAPADLPRGVDAWDDYTPEPPFAERDVFARLRTDHHLSRWVQEVFIDPEGTLHNPDHAHLELAGIGFVWTDAALERKSKRVIGAAEIPNPRGNPVSKLRARWALEELDQWDADFLVTLDSVWCHQANGIEFLALLEHELYHCGQATDENDLPRFNQRTGEPIWTIRAHDVEEFVGVVRRYGAEASSQAVEELVEAARGDPEVGDVDVAAVCGTCRRAA